MIAIAGIPVVNAEYRKERIKIAFDPFAALSDDKDEELFAVQDQSHLKSKRWIPDIAEVFKNDFSVYAFITEYCKENPEMSPDKLSNVLTDLRAIANRLIGVIELADDLDIDIVTDIFIRINSKGTALSQGDFVMSKMAADDSYGGSIMRKAVDYFAHMCVDPSYFSYISENDKEFVESEYYSGIKWLADDKEDVYNPECDDILRVAFMHMYPRARLSDLVSLFSGRDFETREYRADIIEDTYARHETGRDGRFQQKQLRAVHARHTRRGVHFAQDGHVVHGAGFRVRVVSAPRIRSHGVRQRSEAHRAALVRAVRTDGSLRTSPESAFYKDIRNINEKGVVNVLRDIEAATLSDNFWDVRVVQDLSYTSTINPTYLVYLAAQVAGNDLSLLSNSITVKDLIEVAGDVHHIFPKEYLKSAGYERNLYNQNANYAYLDAGVNKSIGKKAPCEYFREAFKQCDTKQIVCGDITDADKLRADLEANCIPLDIVDMTSDDYPEFLQARRKAMARKIKKYYYDL